MTIIIVTVLLIMCIVRTTSTKEVMCHESEVDRQIVVSCSGKYLTDDNYVPSLHWTFDRLRPISSENQSMALLFVNNKIQRLKVLPNRSRTQITEISFKYNSISSSENGVFRNLPHLKSLDLSHNKLTGDHKRKICQQKISSIRLIRGPLWTLLYIVVLTI